MYLPWPEQQFDQGTSTGRSPNRTLSARHQQLPAEKGQDGTKEPPRGTLQLEALLIEGSFWPFQNNSGFIQISMSQWVFHKTVRRPDPLAPPLASPPSRFLSGNHKKAVPAEAWSLRRRWRWQSERLTYRSKNCELPLGRPVYLSVHLRMYKLKLKQQMEGQTHS